MFFLDKTSFQDKQLKELIPMKDDMNEELVNDEARELMRQKRELGCPKLGSLIFWSISRGKLLWTLKMAFRIRKYWK